MNIINLKELVRKKTISEALLVTRNEISDIEEHIENLERQLVVATLQKKELISFEEKLKAVESGTMYSKRLSELMSILGSNKLDGQIKKLPLDEIIPEMDIDRWLDSFYKGQMKNYAYGNDRNVCWEKYSIDIEKFFYSNEKRILNKGYYINELESFYKEGNCTLDNIEKLYNKLSSNGIIVSSVEGIQMIKTDIEENIDVPSGKKPEYKFHPSIEFKNR